MRRKRLRGLLAVFPIVFILTVLPLMQEKRLERLKQIRAIDFVHILAFGALLGVTLVTGAQMAFGTFERDESGAADRPGG